MFGFLKQKTIYRTHDPVEYEAAKKALEIGGFTVKSYVLDSDVPSGG